MASRAVLRAVSLPCWSRPENPRRIYDGEHLAVAERFDLTDGQWAGLEPLLPKPKRSGRPSLWTKRQLIDAIRWRVRVGAPWRDVPPQYGSWSAVYAVFRRWQRDGTVRYEATVHIAAINEWLQPSLIQ